MLEQFNNPPAGGSNLTIEFIYRFIKVSSQQSQLWFNLLLSLTIGLNFSRTISGRRSTEEGPDTDRDNGGDLSKTKTKKLAAGFSKLISEMDRKLT